MKVIVAKKKNICGTFPKDWGKQDIQALELYPILALVGTLAHCLRNSQVKIICDTEPLGHCLNKLSSKNPMVMKLMHPLVLFLLASNISIKASRHMVSGQWPQQHGMDPKWVRFLPSLLPKALKIDSTK